MNKPIIALASLIGAISSSAFAGEMNFSVGASYSTGIGDVVDYYEELLESRGYGVDVSQFPLGVSHTGHYQFDSGLRLGYGVGPAFAITGDVDYMEIPVSATVGYTFAPTSDISPYVFAGPSIHLIDGDYVKDDNATGALYGVGIEFARNGTVSYVLEIAKDTTEVDFGGYTGYYDYYYGYDYEYAPQSIKTYDTVVSFRVMF